jgi:diacylglycerol kinase family enzyme
VISIIINPISGGATHRAARRRVELATVIARDLPQPVDVMVSARRGHARELAAAAVRRGDALVVAWGGDGTVNEVASALVSTHTALAIVPTGSGNGLARELNVARDPRRAIAEAVAAQARPVDAGMLGGRLFFSIAGVGFDAHVAACFDRTERGRRGFSTYVRVSARELMGYRCAAYRLEATGPQQQGAIAAGPARSPARVDSAIGPREVHRALIVTFANSAQFGNGARIAPGAKVDDGLLDMVVFEESSRLATICALPRLFAGGLARLRGLAIQRVARARVDSEAPMRFHVDGEPVQGGTRLDAQVLPGVLRVCVR